jgi:hypothetical protein
MIIVILAACCLAFYGTSRSLVIGWVGILIILEGITGHDVGVFALPFLIASILWLLSQSVIMLPPWHGSDSWRLIEGIRTVCIAVATALMMVMGATAVESFIYGYGFFVLRLTTVLRMIVWWQLVGGCAALLLLLKRLEVPWRRAIHFGA